MYTTQVFSNMHGVITTFSFNKHPEFIEIKMQKERSIIRRVVTTTELLAWNTDFVFTILEDLLRDINKEAELNRPEKLKEEEESDKPKGWS